MSIIDGKKIRDEILQNLEFRIQNSELKPTLVIILIGGNKASEAYVKQKKLAGKKIGASVVVKHLSKNITQEELERLIIELNNDKKVHGIILQLPITDRLDEVKLASLISPNKDVDGFTPGSKFKPATARGVFELLEKSKVQVKGKNVVVVGRGRIAGRPIAELLKEKEANVIVVHSKTKNPEEITRQADILISAVGKPKLITADFVKKGAVVIDVGINKIKKGKVKSKNPKSNIQYLTSKIVGDVDFENVSKIASKITPVPGGVGPMTVAALMQNLVAATSKSS